MILRKSLFLYKLNKHVKIINNFAFVRVLILFFFCFSNRIILSYETQARWKNVVYTNQIAMNEKNRLPSHAFSYKLQVFNFCRLTKTCDAYIVRALCLHTRTHTRGIKKKSTSTRKRIACAYYIHRKRARSLYRMNRLCRC